MTPASGSGFDESAFSTASNVLQEIMTRSSLAGGAGTSTLTELVLVWLNEYRDRSKPHQSTTLTLSIMNPHWLSDAQPGQSTVCLIHFVNYRSPREITPPPSKHLMGCLPGKWETPVSPSGYHVIILSQWWLIYGGWRTMSARRLSPNHWHFTTESRGSRPGSGLQIS